MSLVASRKEKVFAGAVIGFRSITRAFCPGSNAFLDLGEKARCDLHPLVFSLIPRFAYPWIDPHGEVASILVLEMPYYWSRSGSFGPPNACVRCVFGHTAVLLSGSAHARAANFDIVFQCGLSARRLAMFLACYAPTGPLRPPRGIVLESNDIADCKSVILVLRTRDGLRFLPPCPRVGEAYKEIPGLARPRRDVSISAVVFSGHNTCRSNKHSFLLSLRSPARGPATRCMLGRAVPHIRTRRHA